MVRSDVPAFQTDPVCLGDSPALLLKTLQATKDSGGRKPHYSDADTRLTVA